MRAAAGTRVNAAAEAPLENAPIRIQYESARLQAPNSYTDLTIRICP